MAEHKMLPLTSHKNKTFQEVLEKHRDFCVKLLSTSNPYSRKPEMQEFFDFLKERLVIREPAASFWTPPSRVWPRDIINCGIAVEFVARFNHHHTREFLKIIRKFDIKVTSVHPGAKKRSNGQLGHFYRYIFLKFLSLYRNSGPVVDPSEVKELLPFTLHWNYQLFQDEKIPEFFDSALLEDVKNYLSMYYLAPESLEREIVHFLGLVKYSKRESESEISDVNYVFLEDLANDDFFHKNKEASIIVFKKYFFLYMLCRERCFTDQSREPKAYVTHSYKFFHDLDDIVTHMQNFRRYAAWDGTDMDILKDILNMSILEHKYGWYRSPPYPDLHDTDTSLGGTEMNAIENIRKYVQSLASDEVHLVGAHCNIMEYLDDKWKPEGEINPYKTFIDQLKDFQDCIGKNKDIDSYIDKCYLWYRVPLSSGDRIYDFCYSGKRRNSPHWFFFPIIKCALEKKNYKELVIYNALLGEEYTAKMIPNVEDVKNFIRTYQHPHVLKLLLQEESEFPISKLKSA